MFSEKVRARAEAYAKNKILNSGWWDLRDEIKTTYMDGARYGYRAAMNNNRRFLGIEKSDEYFSLANNRIKENEEELSDVYTLF